MTELLLLQIDGHHHQYGVWKTEVSDIKDLQNLHRLPLSPACIAGVSLIDGSTVTLADLPVCIGRAPAGETGNRRVLLLSSGDRATGFMVNGEMESLSVPSEEVIPMPEYLTTDLISSCIMRNAVLVPIINLSALYHQLLKTDQEPFGASFAITQPQKTAAEIRIFRIGNEVFGALSSGGEEHPAPADRITALSLVPQFVRGIVLHRGRVLPVIDLGQRIRRQKIESDGLLIIHESGSASFGLLVNEFHGSLAFPDAVLEDLPPIARSPWLRSAMLQHGSVIPVVDIETLLTVNTETSVDKPLPERYSLDSRFYSLFMTQAAEVVEFSLLGARHALPKSEVEDVLSFAPFRSIPETPEIVIGVKEHNGVLLPVLDLAMVFGRRSIFKQDWKMVLLKNGDFRAFVITEAVFGERSLPLDVQRELPIVLPHHVVYGCYPDADSVRLILNVGAIALHFEKSLVRELLPALSPEMKLAPAEFVASLLGEEAAKALAAEAAASAVSRQNEVPAAQPASDSSQEMSEPAPIAATVTSAEPQAGMEQQPHHVAQEAETGQAGTGEAKETSDEAVGTPALEVSPVFAEEAAEQGTVPIQDEEASRVMEETASAAEEAAKEELVGQEEIQKPEQARPENMLPVPAETIGEIRTEETSEAAAIEQEQAEPALAGIAPDEYRPEPEPTQQQETAPEPEAESPLTQSESEVEPEPESEPVSETVSEPLQQAEQPQFQLDQISQTELQRQSESLLRPEPETPAPVAFTQASQPQPFRSRLSPETRIERTASSQKRKVVYVCIAAVIAVIVLLLLPFQTAKNGKNGESVLETTDQKRTEPVAVKVEPAKPMQVTVEKKAPAPETEPPLELDIPKEKPVTIDVYVVVKDDTLWSISERFTGNPFNYPRIAGENRIADPDLIFPGQRIRLKKKQ